MVELERFLSSRVARIGCLFVASRLALLVVGMLSASLLPSGVGAQPGNLMGHPPAPLPFEIWARWDAEWYLLIAAEGYDVGDRLAGLGLPYERSATAGFLPLYPMLIRALAPVFGPVAAGVLISNICLLMGLVLLDRLVRMEIGGDDGATAGLAACAALLLHPSSLFLSAVYAESLFLMLSIGAFASARSGRFGMAGVLGGLAALTRPFGVLLLVPLLWEWWRWWGAADDSTTRRERTVRGLWILLVPAAMAGYLSFSSSVFGDPLAMVHRQERWRGGLSGPWRAFVRWWEAGPTIHGAHGSTIELVVALVCLVMLIFMVRRLRPSYTLYATAAMALALGSTLWSFSRFSVTLFPFSMFIGYAWAGGRRCLSIHYAFIGGGLGAFFMALFANWWWAG
jgi:hypothetical protein